MKILEEKISDPANKRDISEISDTHQYFFSLCLLGAISVDTL
jgi:hypothetical protein